MSFVTKSHLSVDTNLKFFLLFHKVTFSLGDSDRSDKRSQSQKQQGSQTCDKRKPHVTKGVVTNEQRLLSHRCFSARSAVTPVFNGLQRFVTFVMSQERE